MRQSFSDGARLERHLKYNSMKSKSPVIRQIAWLSMVPQILVMAVLVLAWDYFYPSKGFLYGAGTYLVVSISLRNFIAKDHRSGMQKVKSGDFENAIQDFQKSCDFFTRYEWLDRYRYLTLLSSSRMSYREMALNNMAFSYGQIGDGTKAIAYYKRVLAEYPGSVMATTALKMLESTSEPT